MGAFLRTSVYLQPSVKDKANVVEALFGAVFLDLQYEACRHLWDSIHKKIRPPRNARIIDPSTPQEQQKQAEYMIIYAQLALIPKNAKNTLQELCQKQNLPLPTYTVLEHGGPDHKPFFKVQVTAYLFKDYPRQIFTATGEGRTKRIAEIAAAESLCEQIFLSYVPQDI
ncbi:MAG: hypothetical protein RBG13Loki_2673 [Promethearchaeota archaeon CR_4]|nr:MAG: hypothetical protein RBG13Loki_2673 [Candidatus Lokiarchaeota archaeon CR_4]